VVTHFTTCRLILFATQAQNGTTVWAANQEPGAEGALQEFIAQDEIYKVREAMSHLLTMYDHLMRSTYCSKIHEVSERSDVTPAGKLCWFSSIQYGTGA
jgi:hypothetical protein